MKPIDRLRKEYINIQEKKERYKVKSLYSTEQIYKAMRLFALDCNLVSFKDVELMEFEINRSFKETQNDK